MNRLNSTTNILSRSEMKNIMAGGGDPCSTTCNGFGDCEQQCEEIYWCYETNCAWCYGIGSPEYQNCVGEVHMLKQQCLNNCGKPVGDIS